MAMVSSPAGLTIKFFFFFCFAVLKTKGMFTTVYKNWKVVHLHFSKVLHTDYNVVKTSPFVMVSAPTYSVCYTEFPCAHDSFSIPIPMLSRLPSTVLSNKGIKAYNYNLENTL